MTVPGCANPLLMYGDAGVYRIERSLRFNSSDSAFLSRVPVGVGTSLTTSTMSMWVKRSALGVNFPLFSAGTDTSDYLIAHFQTDDTIRIVTGENGATNQNLVVTAAVFRDTSAWYHIVVQFDFTNATSTDRIKLYVNGARVTLSGTFAAQNYTGTRFNRAFDHSIGKWSNSTAYFSGFIAEVFFIDGQALTPSSFTEVSATTGQLIPKAYTGSFGTNGFWLKFSDNSAATATTLGKDYSGNSNNWTPNNLSVTAGAGNDSLVDTPTSYGTDTGAGGEVRGNYCTWNALAKGSDCTLSNGNLDVAWGSAGSTTQGSATIGMSSGKWYWETTITASSVSPTNAVLGITTKPFNDSEYPGYGATSWGYRGSDGQKWTNTSGSSYGASYANGDVVGVAFDADNGTLTFYKNGSSQGTAFTGLTSGPYFPAIGDQSSSQTFSAASNFGQRAFAYTAPSGFKALCDTNLPAPVVAKPNTVMDVVLYTGTGSALTPTSSLAFNPDWIWIKSRSAATDHALYDVVRGATIDLVSNSTAAETTQTQGLTAFNSNGFSVGTLAKVNTSSATYAAWCWDAGTSTVTNTQGSITSSVRANASAGFSIVTYTGTGSAATVGHGLGVAPSLLIVKQRNAVRGWSVYHKDIGASYYLQLERTDAKGGPYSGLWNDTAPTSTVFSILNDGGSNASGGTYVAYCFAPVTGYSSAFTYTGNQSEDGPMVYLGFRPRWIWIKSSTQIDNHYIYDTARASYNQTQQVLNPNGSGAEDTSSINFIKMDILSNGFKVRANQGSGINTSGHTYVGYAFAENPFQFSRAR